MTLVITFFSMCENASEKRTMLQKENSLKSPVDKEILEFSLTKVDSLTLKEVYLTVEQLPKFGNNPFSLSEYILGRITYTPENELYKVQFIIDENGYLFGARIKGKDYSELDTSERN